MTDRIPQSQSQPAGWISGIIQLFHEKAELTGIELAAAVDCKSEFEAAKICSDAGLPIKLVRTVKLGTDIQGIYALDAVEVWAALERSLQEQNRYSRLLTSLDRATNRPLFADPAAWIAHLKEINRSHEIPSSPAERNPSYAYDA